MKKRFLFLFCLCSFSLRLFPISMRDAHKAYGSCQYKKSENILKQLQVKVPFDPIVNYNLGNTYFKEKNYKSAASNFQRAFDNVDVKNVKFQEMVGFNLGNSYLFDGLDSLGENWENKKLDENVLEQSISLVSSAIKKYQYVLEIDSKNEPAQANLKYAKELLEKLKQKQQSQEQNQDKEQDKDQNQSEKNNEDAKDKESQSRDGSKPDQSQKDGQGQKNNQQDQNGEQDDHQNKEQSSDQNGKDSSQDKFNHDNQDSHSKQNNPSDEKSENNEDKSDLEEPQEQSGLKQENGQGSKNRHGDDQDKELLAGQKLNSSDGVEMQGMQALLDQLQIDESQTQKDRIKAALNSRNITPFGQRNW